jgi:hypothetical protein
MSQQHDPAAFEHLRPLLTSLVRMQSERQQLLAAGKAMQAPLKRLKEQVGGEMTRSGVVEMSREAPYWMTVSLADVHRKGAKVSAEDVLGLVESRFGPAAAAVVAGDVERLQSARAHVTREIKIVSKRGEQYAADRHRAVLHDAEESVVRVDEEEDGGDSE